MINLSEDIRIAENARKFAKSKYSNYSVGAVLKCKNGNRYTGCNIENHGIQAICAERVAFVKALSEGEYEFERIVIVGGEANTDNLERCLPCGYCRQFMSEFVDKDFKVYIAFGDKLEEYTISELLPSAFEL